MLFMMSILVFLLQCITLLSFLFISDAFVTLTVGLKQGDASNMTSSCIEKERQVLVDVKASLIDLNGDLKTWGNKGDKYTDCCKWAGVQCSNDTGHVIELHLNDLDFQFNPIPKVLISLSDLQRLEISNANLSGPIPRELGNLFNLSQLDLSANSLHGPIPHELGNLSNLIKLDLRDNQFRGSIPFSFGDLTNITYLDLSQNQIGGIIPKSLGNWSSPLFLDLSQNLLTGPVPKCSSVYHMSLDHNSLNGSLPDFTGCKNLSYLNLSSNQLSGNVPDSLGQVLDLKVLDFSSNFLEGVITEIHLQNLTSLIYLDLSFNSLELQLSFDSLSRLEYLSQIKLQSCKLGPRFPMWIKTQKRFTYLDISSAGISDSIPAWFWDLPVELQFINISSNEIKGLLPKPDKVSIFYSYVGIDLSNNHLEGSVQHMHSRLSALNLSGNRFSGTLSFLCEIDAGLSFLDLSNNSFSGQLPNCWSKFREKLVVLNLSNNNLSGKISSSLGFLYKLGVLYLRTNLFSGELPMSLSNCTALRFVDLGKNQLSGVIPEWIGEKLPDLYILVLGSNNFYGKLPSKLCWLYKLQILDVSNNALSSNIPRCFDNFTTMASGSFGDDMTSHYYNSYNQDRVTQILSYCVGIGQGSVTVCPRLPSPKTRFLDNALVMWKGKERSFKRTGLQLLKSIDLSRNNLSGIFPHEITSLYDLASLNLSINKLYGEVPNNIGRLKALQSLDLSRNEFFGRIPWSLSHLNFLSVLDLSNNNFSGRIPTGTQLQGFNYTSYNGNPQLCGPPLTPSCGFPPVDRKKDVEEDENDLWKSYYMGMGSGFTIGFLGICSALFLNCRC